MISLSGAAWNFLSALLGGGLVASTAAAYVNIRKSRRDDKAEARADEQHEADLIGTFREWMVKELQVAAKDKDELREEIDQFRTKLRQLENENYRSYELLRESSSYNNALLVHIAQHVHDGSEPPPMPRRLQIWMDEGR